MRLSLGDLLPNDLGNVDALERRSCSYGLPRLHNAVFTEAKASEKAGVKKCE